MEKKSQSCAGGLSKEELEIKEKAITADIVQSLQCISNLTEEHLAAKDYLKNHRETDQRRFEATNDLDKQTESLEKVHTLKYKESVLTTTTTTTTTTNKATTSSSTMMEESKEENLTEAGPSSRNRIISTVDPPRTTEKARVTDLVDQIERQSEFTESITLNVEDATSPHHHALERNSMPFMDDDETLIVGENRKQNKENDQDEDEKDLDAAIAGAISMDKDVNVVQIQLNDPTAFTVAGSNGGQSGSLLISERTFAKNGDEDEETVAKTSKIFIQHDYGEI